MPEDKLTRLLAMQRQLLCGNAIDKAAAAAEYGVSAKSIQRDLETLRAWFGTQGSDLVYDREADAYRLLQPEEARLTKSEVLAVCKILLESRAFTEEELDPHPPQTGGLLHAGAKPQGRAGTHRQRAVPLCAAAPRAKVRGQAVGAGRSHPRPPRAGDGLYGHPHGAARHRRVQPVGILFSEYYFYLAAFIEGIDKKEHFANPEDRSPTIYRVDRIARFTVTKDRFAIPYRDRFQEGEMRKRIQFMYGGRLQHIKFKYTGPNIEAVLDRLPTARVVAAAARRRAGRRSGGVWLGY